MSKRESDPATVSRPADGTGVRDAVLVRIRHDLRTPLNGILGYARHLMGDPALQDRHRSALASIEQCGLQLQSLVDDIADLAQLHVGSLELRTECVELAQVVDAAMNCVRALARDRLVRLAQLGAAGLPRFVEADGLRVRQLLSRLLGFAVRNAAGQGITLRLRALGSAVRFEIFDREIGLGSASEARPAPPRAPVSGHEAKRNEAHDDIELALARALIERMGGVLEERGPDGAGAMFHFDLRLPAWPGHAPTAPGALAPNGYEGPRRRILVVDDVLQNCALISDALSPLGFEVELAADGRDGLERARKTTPDLVVTDIVMPVLDGIEAARRMRQLPALARVPIVALTANAGPEEQRRCQEAGVDACLGKPVDVTSLLQWIGEKLELRWTYDSQEEREDELPFPEGEPLELLHEAARRGSMREVRDWADAISAQDARFLPLAQRLRTLANGLQTKAILALVERRRARGAGGTSPERKDA